MAQGLKIRLGVLLVSTFAALVYLSPSFMKEVPSWWGRFLPTESIRLGLDLQGGTHLILEVKVEAAVKNTMERLRGDLRNLFRERVIPFKDLEIVQQNRILLKLPSESAQKVRDLIKSEFPTLVLVSSQSGAQGWSSSLALMSGSFVPSGMKPDRKSVV